MHFFLTSISCAPNPKGKMASDPSAANAPPPEITIMSPTSPSSADPPRLNGVPHVSPGSPVSATGTSTPSRTPRSGTPITTHLALGGKNHKIMEKTGYTDIRFPEKDEQFRQVIKALRSKGFIPNDLVEIEVYPSLPPKTYFISHLPHRFLGGWWIAMPSAFFRVIC